MINSMKEFGKHLSGQNEAIKNSWRTPVHGWVKVNVDGAFAQASNLVAHGGLIRDSDVTFIQGFICKLNTRNALSVELWACIHGLKLAWKLGYCKIELESDSREAIDCIQRGCDSFHLEYGVISEAQVLAQRDWEVQVRHVPRWINGPANWLAKYELGALLGFYQVI